ncbi:MAG: DUF3592 domain-containing protein [Sarcina sp.]
MIETKTKKKGKNLLGSSIFFILVGIIAFGALLVFAKQVEIYFTGATAQATITSYQVQENNNSKGGPTYTYTPVVSFSAYNQNIQIPSVLSQLNSKIQPVGSVVEVRYNKSNPSEVIISNTLFISNLFTSSIVSFIFPFILLAVYGINKLSIPLSDGSSQLTLRVNYYEKAKACLAFLGLFVLSVANIINEYINISFGLPAGPITGILSIICIIFYLFLLFLTIKEYFLESCGKYVF